MWLLPQNYFKGLASNGVSARGMGSGRFRICCFYEDLRKKWLNWHNCSGNLVSSMAAKNSLCCLSKTTFDTKLLLFTEPAARYKPCHDDSAALLALCQKSGSNCLNGWQLLTRQTTCYKENRCSCVIRRSKEANEETTELKLRALLIYQRHILVRERKVVNSQCLFLPLRLRRCGDGQDALL